MSLRARLGVVAHANETNETLCVSFSHCRRSGMHAHTNNMHNTCMQTESRADGNIHRRYTCISEDTKIHLYLPLVSSSINMYSRPSRKTPSASQCIPFTPPQLPVALHIHTQWKSKYHRASSVCPAAVN